MKLISLLKQAYGQDVNKIPGFLEFVESLKKVNKKILKDTAAQTSNDLLESTVPSLRHRGSISANVSSLKDDGEDQSFKKSNNKKVGCEIC